MIKVIKRVIVNKDLVQFSMEDDKQPTKEIYAYVNGNGEFKEVVIIEDEKRRVLKSFRLTKKYFEVACKWVQVQENLRRREERKKLDELVHEKMIKQVRGMVEDDVKKNVENAINCTNGLDFFYNLQDNYNKYLREENKEKKEEIEKKLMKSVIDAYSVCLYPYYENVLKLKLLCSTGNGELNCYLKDMRKKGYKVNFFNMGCSVTNNFEYLLIALVPIEKNSILELANCIIENENSINDFDEEGISTQLLDELEKKLSDILGDNMTYRILDNVICKVEIDKQDRLRILDDILTLKGID